MKRIALAIGLCTALISEAAHPTRAPKFGPPPRDISICRFGSVDADHRFIVAGVMGGDTLTNLQLGDPNGKSTVVRVVVEAGSQPVTVLLHSDVPVIWDFEGDVERIKRAIIIARNGKQEVASRGLRPEVLKFPDLAGCPAVILPPWNHTNNVELYFGRPADSIVFEGFPHSLSITSGEFARSPPRRFGLKGGESALMLYQPGGFRIIDAKSIVSPMPVLEPETYPTEAGLVQLEKTGAIRPPQRSEIERFVDGFHEKYPSKSGVDRFLINADYVITRDIMLPPALFGAHSKNFLVLPGVPAPRGNAGHGCLFFSVGYRTNNGPSCYGILRD